METKDITTYLEVMCFFRNSLLEGITTEKEYEEIEIKAAKRRKLPVPDKLTGRTTYTKQCFWFNKL